MENYNYNNQGYNQGYPNQQSYQQQTYQNAPTQNYRATPKKGWSWGAFMLGIHWGIGNRVYWPLLSLLIVIPFIGPIIYLVVAIICGIKGHEWAMNSGTFKTVEEYNAAQDTWDRAGKVMFFIMLIMVVISLILSITLGAAVFAGLAGLAESLS